MNGPRQPPSPNWLTMQLSAGLKVATSAPLKRPISADDVGNCAVYLASDLSSQVTADVHFIDAGYHAMGMYPEAPKA